MLTVMQGDCRDRLRELADESVHCCVTSPPYWGLRDYGTAQWEGGDGECDHFKLLGGISAQNLGKSDIASAANVERSSVPYRDNCGKCGATRIDSQLGLEPTPEAYVAKMVEVFREVRRVLRSDGTLWLNLGDSYASANACDRRNIIGQGSPEGLQRPNRLSGSLKEKDLCGIPWLVAFALRADGWYLRSEIIWHKPNPMPESVTDRPTKSHEQVFLLSKSARYFYDAEAIKEPSNGDSGWSKQRSVGVNTWDYGRDGYNETRIGGMSGQETLTDGSRNKRSVWTVATAPYSDAHFATFPPKLIEPCVLAGTSARGCCGECGAPWERVVDEHLIPTAKASKTFVIDARDYAADGNDQGSNRQKDGHKPGWIRADVTTGWQPTCAHDTHPVACTILDPFAGSGTVGKVALEYGRRAILIELNAKYCEMIRKRTNVTLGLPGLA